MRSIHPQAILFIEEPLNSEIPLLNLPNAANGSHWYDVFVLIKRRYLNYFALNPQSKRPIFGAKAIRKSFAKQLEHIKTIGRERVKGPTLIGECGIAYDLNDKIGFTEGRFSEHRKAMNRTYIAIEDNLLSCTLWNYTSDNNNLHGDQWNGEDFSLFSRDQIHSLDSPEDLNAGGRALEAFVRPYPRATAGQPLKLTFDSESSTFTYTFKHDPDIKAPTEFFVPQLHYSNGIAIEVSDGSFDFDEELQLLVYRHTTERDTHTICISQKLSACEVLKGQVGQIEHHQWIVNGLKIHTALCGPPEGEPLLLLHGFPDFWYGWRRQIPFLIRRDTGLSSPISGDAISQINLSRSRITTQICLYKMSWDCSIYWL